MKARKLFLLVTAALLMLSAFFPWVIIESKQLLLTGLRTTGTNYGSPAVLSIFFTVVIGVLGMVPRVWAHRICIFCAALNVGWALRNFLILSTCQGGECPQRQPAFYLYLFSAILLMVAVLIQDMKLPEPKA